MLGPNRARITGVRPISALNPSQLLPRIALLLGCLWLAGCQTKGTPGEQTGAWAKGDFETLGKLALRAPGESLSVRFRWRQVGERYDLELWGPFGQGRTRLVGDRLEMSVLDGRGQVLSKGDPDAVVRAQIGWDLPLLALVSWAQGRPISGSTLSEVVRGDDGRYLGFSQENWQIRYLAYFPGANVPGSSPSGVLRPRTMALETGAYRLKVAFNRWQP